MSIEDGDLADLWRVRNASAVALSMTEEQMRRAVRGASVEQLTAMLDTYSPARSTGPEWTRTFEPLVERLWAWLDDATMAALWETYKKRGPAWLAVANALAPESGASIRSALRHPAWARMPAFATV